MSERRSALADRRAREFEAFVTGAAGRLLHAATLLTAETPDANPRAQRLLTAALAQTYVEWDRLRGEDPYNRTRQELATRFARVSWRRQRTDGGVLAQLTPQERLVVVLRLYEQVAEEQTAALMGLPVERVRTVCRRSVAALCATRRSRPSGGPLRTAGGGPAQGSSEPGP
ncbi:sigma factor-like helix-turn-helix DNA-binding protein [Streptomyces albipurpureus]|uniref:RNA polymerase n=1 Tax=Streptomyces albipurpureus TaxID=2897419 RepID=A0ABT0UKY5_9ACTN|nr:sigma factor-like helix-turn-helix DNA-binding protein [Streptomyces sp. CWNU-1]MCM2389263.1 RNA polymerase [Streptomyces sp. CWNU-1]